MRNKMFLTDAQLQVELKRCENCEEKPCKTACPADCSPADFIMAAQVGEKFDYKRAAAEILTSNPLGGICGLVCPDKHCMVACTREKFDTPINIPIVQATIVEKAKQLGVMPSLKEVKRNGKKVAVIGAGPSGLAAALTFAQMGYEVSVYEKESSCGGSCNLIPEHRLPKEVIESDLEFTLKNPNINLITGKEVSPEEIKNQFDAVVVSIGLWNPIKPGINGEEQAVYSYDYLKNAKKYSTNGCVAIVGGGAIAVDCAVTAKKNGAKHVEMFVLESLGEMPLTANERKELLEYGIDVTTRTKVKEIKVKDGKIAGLLSAKIALVGEKFSLKDIAEIDGTDILRNEFTQVVYAIGSRSTVKVENQGNVFAAGDCKNGPTTVVEAAASGKNAALEVDAFLNKKKAPEFKKHVKSHKRIDGYDTIPVSLETDFFGRKLISPFILSAAPPSDGYDQMKKAYESGWAGGIMKTAFDGVSIHIPGEYMHQFDSLTYGNCDNVSGHPLSRVCGEISQLVKEYPDRLTIASTGGPVSGNDHEDKKQWQKNTKMLEDSGAMAIEYSLSCPQGGDGTEGDIVSQNPALTAKIIDWIMESGNADVPKLFKLTAQVTSIKVIINAIKEVFERYPNKKAGITLANTFPTVTFRKGKKAQWEEGIIVGMSGRGVAPISNLTLANVAGMGVHISGNGGPVSYIEAAHFLAMGVQTVQFCTVAMKYGYSIIDELHSGLSHLMAERNIKSMKELIGRAVPNLITDFMELTPVKKISSVKEEFCINCGNCARCSYFAITLNDKKIPEMDPERCIGCSICVQKCIAGALEMRTRTEKELALLKED